MRSTTARRGAIVAAVTAALIVGTPLASQAATTYPSDTAKPDLVSLLNGYTALWEPDGANDLHGSVKNIATLQRNDALTVWINQHATSTQQFHALQDAEYQDATNSTYDQSMTISTGLGSVLGKLYVEGRNDGDLPLTSALINSTNGTTGAYLSTGTAKATFSYPRPYLPTSSTASAVTGDDAACTPSAVNGSSLASIRAHTPWTTADGSLRITRVPDTTDTTHQFSPNDVALSVGYGTKSLCTGGSFPSGHTTTAYEAGITLATLLPELAPEIFARTSENANDRIVLGVHYPLDIIGGRIDGEAALAARWSDAAFRKDVLEPARTELVSYLESKCGGSLSACIAREKHYSDNPYGGARIPGGTSQIVTDRRSAVAVYRERMTYGFSKIGTGGQRASVPAGAENLLLTTFPTLTDAQRTSVLAQTEIDSGYPLDGTGTAAGSWQRLNLAAATSATVRVNQRNGAVSVLTTGGTARVVQTGSSGHHGGHHGGHHQHDGQHSHG